MSGDEIFHRLLHAMLLKDESKFDAAVTDAAQMNISPPQLQHIMEKIELWCRMKGLLPLKPNEYLALLKLQSFFRCRYVRLKLMEKYKLYVRLSMTDSEDYACLAHKYHRILKL